MLGTTSYDKIVEAVEEALEGKSEVELADINALPLPETKRLVTTGGHYAYLKIAEGCDKHWYILYYPESPWKLPQCTDGASDQRSTGTG